ncbi:MAG: hypothetical protein ACP6IY_22665 [Promethearchaeia archaeon]
MKFKIKTIKENVLYSVILSGWDINKKFNNYYSLKINYKNNFIQPNEKLLFSHNYIWKSIKMWPYGNYDDLKIKIDKNEMIAYIYGDKERIYNIINENKKKLIEANR